MNTTTTETLGLVLPGGGARGAYQVGALKAISEIVGSDRCPFPVITGASVGGITAALLAANAQRFGVGVQRLVQFWSTLHCYDIYRTEFLPVSLRGLHWVVSLTPVASLGLPNPKSFLDNSPLHDLLRERVKFEQIDEAIQSGALRAVSVTASSYDRSRAVTFYQGAPEIKNWNRSRREGQAAQLSVDHLVASAALPFVFPAQKVGNEYYGDGSLRLTSPLSPAIHTGADKILVISSRDARLDSETSTDKVEYPSLGAISGTMLDIIFMDNVNADIERAKRIDHTLSLISPNRQNETPLRDIEVVTLEPSQDIRDIAREHAHTMPWTVRMLMGRLGLWGHDWRLPSYLMFEPEYCSALIDLGYSDTMARANELKTFFGLPQTATHAMSA